MPRVYIWPSYLGQLSQCRLAYVTTESFTIAVRTRMFSANWALVVSNVVCIIWRRVYEHLRSLWWSRPRRQYSTYTPQEEAAYWVSAVRTQRALSSSNGMSLPSNVPLPQYYTPKLLPVYRSTPSQSVDVKEYLLAPKTFCKWHRMVFAGPCHPSMKDASDIISDYSYRDRKEMYRISRLQTDKEVFERTVPWTPRYRDMWREWLRTKGPDFAIVFA